MINIDKNLEKQLNEIGYKIIFQNDKDMFNMNPELKDCDSALIYDEQYTMKHINLPSKKLVDFDYIMNKINSDQVYQNFSNNFRELLKGIGLENSVNVYPTSYGIGFFVLFNFRNNNGAIQSKIKELLDSKGIEYRNEFSDAGWVFRYRISKSKENIEKMKI